MATEPDQSASERGPEVIVNGKSVGFGMEGMARALGAMIGTPASCPAEDRAAQERAQA